MCSSKCIIIIVIINIILYIVFVVCQNCQVIVTSFDCCWCSVSVPPESWLVELLQRPWEDGCRGMEGDSGIAIKDVCEDSMRNLGGGSGADAHKGRYFILWCGSGGGGSGGSDGDGGGRSDVFL